MDAHIHLDPMGSNREAVRRFKNAGGTHLIIVHKPYHHIPENDLGSYKRSFRTTIEMTEIARNEGVEAYCVIGPYPGSLPHQANTMGLEEAFELQLRAIQHAFDLIDEGYALGVGEVGRVHFKVEEEIMSKCDEILMTVFKGSKERNCPVVLHTESPRDNPDLFRHLSSMVGSASMTKHRVIKHYSGWESADPSKNMGLSVSMQARRSNLEKALSNDFDFLLETDFIDENDRPNVVMPPDTVPKKIEWAYRKDLLDSEKHHHLMVDLPKKILGIDMDRY